MKKVWIVVGVVLVVGVFIGLNVWQKSADSGPVAVETTTLEEQEMMSTVMTPGTLKLKSEQTVYASPQKGELAEILVEEGDTVEEDEALLRYTNEQLDLEKEQNALQIESSYLRINTVKKQGDRLDDKEEELAKEVGKDEAAEAIEQERDQNKMELRSANIELKQLLLQEETIEKQMAELTVKSDITGTVLEVNEDAAQAADQSNPEPVLRIAALDQLVVEGVISEYDTLKVEEGQPVSLSSDAVPDKEWQGKVTQIAFLPEQSPALGGGGQSETVQYPVVVSVEDENIGLKPGFQMIMDIQTEKRKVLTLPLSALVEQENQTMTVDLGTGATGQSSEAGQYVFVVKDGKVEQRDVEVGMVDGDRIEIRDGVKSDEQVVVEPPATLRDGAEVTVP